MNVLFVGQNPSRDNLTKEAFIGSKSGNTLLAWIRYLNVDKCRLFNASTKLGKVTQKNVRRDLKAITQGYDIVIALGNYASKALTKRNIDHFKLPHPSGLNRKLNDLEYIKNQLDFCKAFIFIKQHIDCNIQQI